MGGLAQGGETGYTVIVYSIDVNNNLNMSKTITTSSGSGFRGYRSAMEFQGIERELFSMYMIAAKQELEDRRARFLFGAPKTERKYKPMVYGK
jgi:hypothetical protein